MISNSIVKVRYFLCLIIFWFNQLHSQEFAKSTSYCDVLNLLLSDSEVEEYMKFTNNSDTIFVVDNNYFFNCETQIFGTQKRPFKLIRDGSFDFNIGNLKDAVAWKNHVYIRYIYPCNSNMVIYVYSKYTNCSGQFKYKLKGGKFVKVWYELGYF